MFLTETRFHRSEYIMPSDLKASCKNAPLSLERGVEGCVDLQKFDGFTEGAGDFRPLSTRTLTFALCDYRADELTAALLFELQLEVIRGRITFSFPIEAGFGAVIALAQHEYNSAELLARTLYVFRSRPFLDRQFSVGDNQHGRIAIALPVYKCGSPAKSHGVFLFDGERTLGGALSRRRREGGRRYKGSQEKPEIFYRSEHAP
jgi:hypothetical protein